MRGLALTTFVLVMISSAPAFSCICVYNKTAEGAYSESGQVFLGEVVSVKRNSSRRQAGSPNPIRDVETVSFRVLKSWKNSQKPGDVIEFISTPDGGTCDLTVSIEGASAKEEVVHPRFRVWLVYTSEKRPNTLTHCTRTFPAEEQRAKEDMEVLDTLVGPR